MGVRGLTTFVQRNGHLLKEHRLHDCSLVIDGANLYHTLYNKHRINACLGGDYNVFHEVLASYFEPFRKCNIQVYVVLTGVNNDRKLDASIDSHKQKLQKAIKLSRVTDKDTVLPVMAKEVFKQVLKEEKIAHAHSDFKVDDDIVALANRLQCPVLSQDSDFYLYDVQRGYVEFTNLRLHPVKLQKAEGKAKAYHYLQCRIYYTENFLACFNIVSREVMPLISALLGDDFVSFATFCNFMTKVQVPEKLNSRHSIVSVRCSSNVVRVLSWLQSVTPEEAVAKVLELVRAEDKKRFMGTLLPANQRFVCRDSLAFHLGLSPKIRPPEEGLVSFGGNRIPDWFSGEFRSGLLPPFMAKVAICRRVFLKPQAGDDSLSSTSTCYLAIRQAIYGLILSVDRGACDAKDALVVTEYGDDGRKMCINAVEPLFCLGRSSSPLPSLHDLRAMSAKEQRYLLWDVLRIGRSAGEILQVEVPSDWSLFCYVLIYWMHSTAAKVHPQFLNAVLLTALHVYLTMPRPKRGETPRPPKGHASPTQGTCKKIFETLEQSKEELKLCELRLLKHWHHPKTRLRWRSSHLDFGALQWFSELQSCLKITGFLNSLLGSPLDDFRPSHFLNGTLVYNLYQELKGRPQPESYLTDTLGANSLTCCCFLKFRDCVLSQVSKDRSFTPQSIVAGNED